jgi:DsbC/DsbD-like thiol-disulfide interchange protein
MKKLTDRRGLTAGIVAALATLFVSTGASRADDESAWDKATHAAVRLIAGATTTVGRETFTAAGIEIRLDAGWKTYWRYPGDSGIPPRFDFSRSLNVKDVAVRWPGPRRFDDAEGHTIGYKDSVVLPLRVIVQNRAAPARITLDLDYAICEKLCVPANARAELALTGAARRYQDILARAEAAVPRPVRIGDAGAISIQSVSRNGADGRVIVDVAAENPVELFAEGPAPEWALPLPSKMDGAPAGVQRFAFAIDGVPPGVRPDGAMLRLTAVAGGEAIEAEYRLD